MSFETSSMEHATKIVEINAAISKLEKTRKITENDPKIERQIQYYNNELTRNSSKAENDIRVLNAKLEAFTAKIENEIRQVKEKEETYKKFCIEQIHQRESPSNKIHEIQLAELVKERNYHQHRYTELQSYEKELKIYYEKLDKQKHEKSKELWVNGVWFADQQSYQRHLDEQNEIRRQETKKRIEEAKRKIAEMSDIDDDENHEDSDGTIEETPKEVKNEIVKTRIVKIKVKK